jgi:hypothetical protein
MIVRILNFQAFLSRCCQQIAVGGYKNQARQSSLKKASVLL